MFSMREFVKRGLIEAIGKQPTYWVIMNSVGYLEKGILLQEDLAEINEKLTPVVEEEIVEE